MKKLVVLMIVIIGVSGCFDDTSDLHAHIVKVKSMTPNVIDPMPAVSKYGHFEYSAQALRSPFDEPRAEAIQQKIQQMSGCLSPDPRRRKQPLASASSHGGLTTHHPRPQGVPQTLVDVPRVALVDTLFDQHLDPLVLHVQRDHAQFTGVRGQGVQ